MSLSGDFGAAQMLMHADDFEHDAAVVGAVSLRI
jgi:hypothetical protein